MIGSFVAIEPEVWLAARVFVGPGVTVGHGAVVGACSVVLKDLPPMMICAGHPAKAPASPSNPVRQRLSLNVLC